MRPIDADALMEKAKYINWRWRKILRSALMAIEVYTEEDVRQAYTDGYSCGMEQGMEKAVRHGRWVMKHRHHGGFRRYTGVDDYGEQHTITVDERVECDEPYCPFCGKWNESVYLNYCPNCGAKMDGAE